MQRYVAVVGPGTPEDPALLEAAGRAGRLLAEAGHVVVTGGLGGVMAAAAAGASAVGGSWGTLSEVALALRTGVPVLAVGFWDLSGFPAPEPGPGPIVCADVDEAVARIPEVLG